MLDIMREYKFREVFPAEPNSSLHEALRYSRVHIAIGFSDSTYGHLEFEASAYGVRRLFPFEDQQDWINQLPYSKETACRRFIRKRLVNMSNFTPWGLVSSDDYDYLSSLVWSPIEQGLDIEALARSFDTYLSDRLMLAHADRLQVE